MSHKTKLILIDLVLLTIILGAFYGLFLGGRPFAAPDEGRYVEIPREMVLSGDYVTPRLNGIKYFEKPPLMYWLQTIPLKIWGIQESAMRLVPLSMGILGCLITYLAGFFLWDRKTGLLSAITLGTSILYYALSRLIILDMGVSTFITGALISFIIGIQKPPGMSRRICVYLFSICVGLALLAKGLIALAIPGCIILLWVCVQNQWKNLLPLYWPSALLLFLGIGLPWHILAAIRNPEFLEFYFVHEHFTRFLTTVHHRYQPWWFFIPVIIVGFMPWVAFFIGTTRDSLLKICQNFKEVKVHVFLWIWIIFIFLFFSASNSKLIPYILPIFPALSLLTGHTLKHMWDGNIQAKKPFLLYGFSMVGLSLASFISLNYIPFEIGLLLKPYIICLSIWLGLGGIVVLLVHHKWGQKGGIACILFFTLGMLLILNEGASKVDRLSTKEFAHVLKTTMPEKTEVVTYGGYFQDLPVYLNKTVKIYDWQGELAFGMSLENVDHIVLNPESLKKLWTSQAPVCMILSQNRYQALDEFYLKTGYKIMKQQGHILFCKAPLSKAIETL